MISNNTIRIGLQPKKTQALSWIRGAAFCLSVLWHGVIFHILSPSLSCPWVGDAGMPSDHFIKKTFGTHYSAEATPIPAYLISSNPQSASTMSLFPSSAPNHKKAVSASELMEEKPTSIPKENNYHVYELNAYAMGWKVSAPVIQYPTAAFSKQQQGIVILQGSLNQKRGFDDIQVLRTSGVHELDQAAILWFKKVKLIPTHTFFPKFGTLFTQSVQFQLEK